MLETGLSLVKIFLNLWWSWLSWHTLYITEFLITVPVFHVPAIPFFLAKSLNEQPNSLWHQSSPNTISVKEQCWGVFSYWVLAESESPEAFVCGSCRTALTVALTFIKGHPFLECKSITLLVTSLHLPVVLVNICNSTTGNTSGTGKALENKICFMVLKKKKNPVYVNNKIVCPKWNLWKFTAGEFFFTRVKKVWWKSFCVCNSESYTSI